MNITHKILNIPDDWKIVKNEFMDLEPDNDYPIDDVWTYFEEDILYLEKDDFFVDLGFYGGLYLEDRSGFFKIVVGKGDYNEYKILESFITRSTNELKVKIEQYLHLISTGDINKYDYCYFKENEYPENYLISVVDKIKVKLSDNDFEKYEKPKK